MRIAGVLLLTLFEMVCLNAQPFPHVIWQRDGAGDSSRYGGRITALGDQNQDGYADFAVDAWGWGPSGQASEALTEFFHGGNPPSAAPYYVFHGGQDSTCYGCRAIGDVNGDGFIDWEVAFGVPDAVDYWMRIYWGGPTATFVPVVTWHMQNWRDSFIPIGDFNGDGYNDLYYYHWQQDWGQAFFGAAVLDTIPDWTRHSSPGSLQQAWPGPSGDLNRDGYADWIGGDGSIFWGGAQPDSMPGVQFPCGMIVNDMNGDGYPDLACGLDIYWGGQTVPPQPSVSLTMPCDFPGGGSVRGVGDINHDGRGDLVITEQYCGNDEFGTAMLYLGSPWMTSAPAYTFWGGDPPAAIIGHRVAAGLGDVNGDGIDDFALGGFNDTNQGFRGRAVIIAGDSSLRVGVSDLPPTMPQQFTLSVYPNPFNTSTTISYTMPRAGEVKVELFDLTGRLVKILCEGRREAGEHSVRFEGKGLSSGVYVARVQAGGVARAVKVMLLK